MSSSIITFPANNEYFRKRKRVHKACELCKKKRKRCHHTFDEEGGATSASAVSPATFLKQPPDTPKYSVSDELTDGSDSASEDSRVHRPGGSIDPMTPNPERFVGDLNPEAAFRGLPGGLERERGQRPDLADVGYFVSDDKRAAETATKGRSPGEGTNTLLRPLINGSEAYQALQRYLKALGVELLPPRRQQDALLRIYMTHVQPILPILDQNAFEAAYEARNEPLLLMQAVCLVASKHDSAREHLYLGDDPSLMKTRAFSRKLYNAINAALYAKLEKDVIVLIRVLTLLSFHYDGHDGSVKASMHLSQAIHHAHSFGLHMGRTKERRDEALEKLFWCLSSLDKLNASINGRPIMMFDIDNGIDDLTKDPEHKYTAFGVWLQLSAILDKVISFYRPTAVISNTGWEENFPSFEDIIGEGANKLTSQTLAALELFYHAIAMLSCRSRPVQEQPQSTFSYLRQKYSASQVIKILQYEPPGTLPPLPVVPYSVSLSLSVSYRLFRQSKLALHQSRAKEDMRKCCELLDKLKDAWFSARVMGELGEMVLSRADAPASIDNSNEILAPPKRRRPTVQVPEMEEPAAPSSEPSVTPKPHSSVEPTAGTASQLPGTISPNSSHRRAQSMHLDRTASLPPLAPYHSNLPGQQPISSMRTEPQLQPQYSSPPHQQYPASQLATNSTSTPQPGFYGPSPFQQYEPQRLPTQEPSLPAPNQGFAPPPTPSLSLSGQLQPQATWAPQFMGLESIDNVLGGFPDLSYPSDFTGLFSINPMNGFRDEPNGQG